MRLPRPTAYGGILAMTGGVRSPRRFAPRDDDIAMTMRRTSRRLLEVGYLESDGAGDGKFALVGFDDAEDGLTGGKSFQLDGGFFGKSQNLIGAVEVEGKSLLFKVDERDFGNNGGSNYLFTGVNGNDGDLFGEDNIVFDGSTDENNLVAYSQRGKFDVGAGFDVGGLRVCGDL